MSVVIYIFKRTNVRHGAATQYRTVSVKVVSLIPTPWCTRMHYFHFLAMVLRQSVALSSTIQARVGRWRTECQYDGTVRPLCVIYYMWDTLDVCLPQREAIKKLFASLENTALKHFVLHFVRIKYFSRGVAEPYLKHRFISI